MKIKEIKIEALRLMFANADDILVSSDYGVYKNDEKYKIYLDAMDGAINRCLNDIKLRRVNDTITLDIPRNKIQDFGQYYKVNTSELNPKVFEIKRMISIDKYGRYNPKEQYQMVGKNMIFGADAEKTYTIEYYEDITSLNLTSDGDNELDNKVTRELQVLIPYYIKSDIYRDDEPSEASNARTYYENGIAMIQNTMNTKDQAQSMVDMVFNMGWM